MTSSIVKYSVERFFLVKTFWLKKKFPNQLQMIQKVKKTVAGQIRSAGRTGPTGRQNRRPFFSRFGSFGVIKTEKNGRRSNSVRRTVRPADRSAKPATFFHVLDH